MSAASGHGVDAAARNEVSSLVTSRVKLRFAVDADAFADRLIEIATAEDASSVLPLRDRVLRLSLDDLYLAWACVRADNEAWREFARAHFEFIRSFTRRYLTGHAAVDVADEVIADLWERGKLERYRGRSTLRTWLGALVTHAALNAAKSRQHRAGAATLERETASEETAKPSGGAAEEVGDEQARGLLKRMVGDAVGELPAEEKALLRLYYEQELTLDEMSGVLGISGAALSRRLKHTRETLRAAVEARSLHATGVTVEALRHGIDLGRLEVDLGALLGSTSTVDEERGSAV